MVHGLPRGLGGGTHHGDEYEGVWTVGSVVAPAAMDDFGGSGSDDDRLGNQ